MGVRLEEGDEIHAPLVISSAGVVNTYGKFLRNAPNIKSYSQQLKTVTPTPSYVCLYMGLNKSAEELKLGNTNLWIYPSYNHDYNVSTFLNDVEKDFPVIYISFPSAKDPTFSEKHPSASTMEAITVSPWKYYDKWSNKPWKNRGENYEMLKSEISDRILEKVYKYVPKAQSVMDYHELSTPLSVKSLANYQQGELYGINHDPERFRQKWLRPKTDIKNLYLTGQDVITVGVTSALFSGLLTASAILKKNLMNTIVKD